MLLTKPTLTKPVFTVFPDMKEKIEKGLCATCGQNLLGESTEFRDDISREEYTVSGMCQKCQDIIFSQHDI